MKNSIAALLLAVLTGLPLVDRSAAAEGLRVIGTELWVSGTDGTHLGPTQLVGSIVSFLDARGRPLELRIDAVDRDPGDPAGEVLLYRFMHKETDDGPWKPLCPETHDGLPVGFPLRGAWGADGSFRSADKSITLVCAQSAVGKCLRLGYKLWGRAADGTPLSRFHQACTRLMRADYCGDGSANTRDGTPIRIDDRLGLRAEMPAGGAAFEALWGPQGAVCVNRPRLPDVHSLDDLVAACPRLAGRVGPACGARQLTQTPDALLRSYGMAPQAAQP